MSSYRPLDGQPDELGVTELPDDLAAIALGNQIFKFHIPSPYRGGGHWRSMLKFPHIIFEDRKATKSWNWHCVAALLGNGKAGKCLIILQVCKLFLLVTGCAPA
jgi:hypothetical protein